jgi:hypothetical protein
MILVAWLAVQPGMPIIIVNQGRLYISYLETGQGRAISDKYFEDLGS